MHLFLHYKLIDKIYTNMKLDELRFFSPEENKATKQKEEAVVQPTGYISATGKIIIPQKSADEVGLNSDNQSFKIGVQENKRKLKSLYFIPASPEEEGTFEMKSSGRNNFIPLGVILDKSGVDFQNNKFTFEINSYQFDENVSGYEIKLDSPIPRTKRAGRKAKSQD